MNERGVFVDDDPLLSFDFVNLTRPCIWPVKFVSLKRSIAIKKNIFTAGSSQQNILADEAWIYIY